MSTAHTRGTLCRVGVMGGGRVVVGAVSRYYFLLEIIFTLLLKSVD